MNAAVTGADGALAGRRSEKRALLGDLALAAACLAALVVVGVELARSPVHRTSARAEPVAMLAFTSDEVRRRADSTLVWEEIFTGGQAYQRDTLFVPPGSNAVLRFRDGSMLQLEQDSLIVIEAPKAGPQKKARSVNVELQRGSISGKAGTAGLMITTGSGSAELSAGAEARVRMNRKSQMHIEKLSGSAWLRRRAGGKTLQTGASTLLDAQGRAIDSAAPRVRLVQPTYGARVYYHEQAPVVGFAWRDPGRVAAALQLAADRDFIEHRASRTVEGERARLPLADEGNTYWRIVDANGEPVSDTGFFVVLRDEPPVISSPGENEVVSITGDQPVRLAWTAVTGVTSYLIELGSDPELGNSASRFRAEGTQYWWSDQLTEGVYYFRVRADDPERENPPFSRTARFRLITRPLPAVPELLEVEYRF